MPAPAKATDTKANDDTRAPMRITAIRRDAQGLHITLRADADLLRNADGTPLPKAAALAQLKAHIAKAVRS